MLSQKELESLLKTLESGGVSEFEYEDEKVRLRVAFPKGVAVQAAPALIQAAGGAAAGPSASKTAAAAAAQEEVGVVYVTSPFVGTFYRAPGPDSANFVEVGSTVKKGQTLCIVEAMKLMNEIEAELGGTILEILVDNGKSVEFGQKLFKVQKA
jgi:acetyl-CoA carboxylase biotin carboxyl carrier protein